MEVSNIDITKTVKSIGDARELEVLAVPVEFVVFAAGSE